MEILFIAIAFVIGFLFYKIGLPPLLGFLTGGFVLSVYGYQSTHALDELAHSGVIFLLFTLGLKIRLKNFLQPEVAVSGLLQIVISVALLFGLFTLIGMNAGFTTSQTVLLGILLGVASTVIAAKGLEDKGELDAYHGRLAIGILVMEDIILIGILAFTGLKAPSAWALALLLIPLLKPVLVRVLRLIKNDELLLLYGILMAFGGAALFEYVGLGGELGAFCFGVLHAGEEKASDVSKKLWSLREAFLTVFFLKIGLTGLPSWTDLFYALVLVLILPFRIAVFFGILSAFRLRARTRAPVNAKANQLFNKLEPLLTKFESKRSRSDAEPVNIGIANYLIVGMGRAGTSSYDYFQERGLKVVGFDTDPDVLASQRSKKRRVLYGDANSKLLWQNLDIHQLQGVVITIPEEEAKMNVVEALRARGFDGHISVMVDSESQAKQLKSIGVNTICSPLVQAGVELAEKVVVVHKAA
jgi:glutathione-regulated potassium-efflux system ancillary protein KefC